MPSLLDYERFVMTVTDMPISAKVVDAFAKAVPWAKAIKKAASTSRGQRVFPSQLSKHDSKMNFRLDKGSEVDGLHELILQANKNAEDHGVNEAAAKDSHAILAKIFVDPVNDKEGLTASQDLIAAFKNTKQ